MATWLSSCWWECSSCSDSAMLRFIWLVWSVSSESSMAGAMSSAPGVVRTSIVGVWSSRGPLWGACRATSMISTGELWPCREAWKVMSCHDGLKGRARANGSDASMIASKFGRAITVKAWWLHATKKARGATLVGGRGCSSLRQSTHSMPRPFSQKSSGSSHSEREQILQDVGRSVLHVLHSPP